MFGAKVRITMAVLLVTMLFAEPFGMQTAVAEEEELWVPPPIPGIVQGVGTFFQLTDSAYLNVSLQSTALIEVSLSSAPSVVEIVMMAADGALATEASLSGLAPNTTYYKYEDDLHNLVVFTTDDSGTYLWSQDLIEPHLIILQLQPSTKYINASTGGDCGQIGIWEASTLTCYLTSDVNDTIQIDSSNVTLDGQGHTLQGTRSKSYGVFIPKGLKNTILTGISVMNLTIQGFHNGIGLSKANRNHILNNTIRDVVRGISLDTQSSENTFIGNAISEFENAGFYLFNAGGNFIRGNSIVGVHPVGIWVSKGSNNQITGNRIIGPDVGIQLDTDINKVIRNTVNDAIAPLDGNGFRNSTYNNNFLGYQSAFQNSKNINQPVNTGLPLFGNFWHGYDTEDPEGCFDANLDLICDAPYQLLNQNGELAGVDNFPWKKPNGWHPIQITAPVAPQLIGTPISASAVFSDLDVLTLGKHTAEWDWGDGTTSVGTVSETWDGSKVVGTVTAPAHDYPLNAGIYELKLKISESYYMSYVEKVFQYIVIYDPSAGFVTGGGRFHSVNGTYYLDDPNVPLPEDEIRLATFGFISKYQKGATVPEGQTVFEFQDGDLYFKSFSYDFLVLAADKATFKGTGTVNDEPGYSFFITAIDGDIDEKDVGDLDDTHLFDTFRIRIWQTETLTWIYDNQMGAPIDVDSTTALLEGSIIIQVASTVRGK